MKQGNTELYAMLAIILLWVVAVVGWGLNIIKLIGIASDPITGMFIIRSIGIFVAPLGSILGLFV